MSDTIHKIDYNMCVQTNKQTNGQIAARNAKSFTQVINFDNRRVEEKSTFSKNFRPYCKMTTGMQREHLPAVQM